MHDSRLEEQLRAALRAEGGGLPLTVTAAELERRLAVRRRERNGRRLTTAAAAAVAVVAIGSIVAIGNGWLRMPAVGGDLSPSPSVDATPSTDPAASTDPNDEPSASQGEALPCDTIDPADASLPPSLIVGTTLGDDLAYGVVLGAFQLGSTPTGDPEQWLNPGPEVLDTVPAGPPTARLQVLASGPDACVTAISADARRVDRFDDPEVELATFRQPAGRVAEFDQPAPGLWIVRVRVDFATTTGTAWTIGFFRVEVRDEGAVSTPRPETLPALAAPDGTVLLDESSLSDRPAPSTGELRRETLVGALAQRGQYQVAIVCLGETEIESIRWSIGHDGRAGTLAAGSQECDGTSTPRSISLGVPSSELDLFLYSEPTTVWHVIVTSITGEPSFIAPGLSARAEGEDPSTGTLTYGRCVSHAGTSESCPAPWFPLVGVGTVNLPNSARLTLGLEGSWMVQRVHLTAIPTALVRGNAFASGEREVARMESLATIFTLPLDLPAGDWIVRVTLDAVSDTDTFGAYYDIPVYIVE